MNYGLQVAPPYYHYSYYYELFKIINMFTYRDPPHTLESTDSVVYLRFYTNSDMPNNGFKARLKIGKHYTAVRRCPSG